MKGRRLKRSTRYNTYGTPVSYLKGKKKEEGDTFSVSSTAFAKMLRW